MIKGKYKLTLTFNSPYPLPIIHKDADNVEQPSAEQRKEFAGNVPPDVTHYVEFYEENGMMKAVHQTELSKQLVDDLVISDNCVSWKAYSGTEGVDLWQYCFAYTQISDTIAGVCFGLEPFFRGYMLMYGERVSE